MQKYILTVTLNPALDRFVLSKKEIISAGGKGINVARALKCLNVPALSTGIVGGHAGKSLTQLMDKENLKYDFCKVVQETRMNTTYLNKPKGKSKRVIKEGTRVSSNVNQKFIAKYKLLLKSSRMVVITGRNLDGLSAKIYNDLILLSHQNDVPIAVDTHGKALKSAVQARPEILKINIAELKELFSLTKLTKQDIMRSILSLHRKGIDFVLISLAEKGAICSNRENMFQLIPKKTQNTFDVGCGDAMLAGFISSFIKKEPFLKNCQWAIGCGSANLKSFLPGQIRRRDAQRIIREIKVKDLM